VTSYGYDISKIERTRVSRGLTKNALAKLANVHPSTVANVLAGTSGTPTTIGKLAIALGISLTDLTIPLGEALQTPDGGQGLQTRQTGGRRPEAGGPRQKPTASGLQPPACDREDVA
tara:strand:- start:409 stop:759 length:351 start_codon:yes stop_codon:yes gene_type:complete